MNLVKLGVKIGVAVFASLVVAGLVVGLYPPFTRVAWLVEAGIFLFAPFVAVYIVVVRKLSLRDLLAFTVAMVPFTQLGIELLKRGFISPWEGVYEVYLYRTLLALGAIGGAYLLTIRLRLLDRIVQK